MTGNQAQSDAGTPEQSSSHPGQQIQPQGGAEPQQHPLESVPDIRVSASFEGPLPPPTLLRGYNDIVPGLAESISENWLKESEFRRHHLAVTEAEIPKRGQTYGLIITVLAIGVCGYAVHLGHTGWGIAGMMGALATVVTVMMWGRGKR